jgi:hypothetical protein
MPCCQAETSVRPRSRPDHHEHLVPRQGADHSSHLSRAGETELLLGHDDALAAVRIDLRDHPTKGAGLGVGTSARRTLAQNVERRQALRCQQGWRASNVWGPALFRCALPSGNTGW